MRRLCLPFVVLIAVAALLLHVHAGQSPPPTVSVRGKIVLEGTLPAPRPIQTSSDPGCATAGPQTSDPQDDVIVYARPINPTPSLPPSGVVVLDRKGCRYVPHTLTVLVGQKLSIRNSDLAAHNVHAFPSINKAFNIALPRQGGETLQVFDKEEPPFLLRDDIHNWESARIGVFSHPYHVVVKLNGNYEFKLPPGPYELVVWPERFGMQTQMFESKAGETRELNIVIK